MKFKNWRKNVVMASTFLLLAGTVGIGPLGAQSRNVQSFPRMYLDGSYLGIEMEEVTAENMAKYKLSAEAGVIIRSVTKGSPAEAARLQENDVILEYAGIPVMSMASLSRLVGETPVGRTVNLTISRDGKKTNVAAKVAERKDALPGDRLELAPRILGQLYDQIPPGSGILQYRVPEARSRSFSLVIPSIGRPVLGATVTALTDQMAEFLGVPGKKGVLVTEVTTGSPAASALRAGDVIVSMDGTAVASPAEVTRALVGKSPGSKVDLKVVRDKKEISLTVDFSKPGASAKKIRV